MQKGTSLKWTMDTTPSETDSPTGRSSDSRPVGPRLNLGTSLTEHDIKVGLAELDSLFSFDLANTRPADWEYMFKPSTLEDAERQRKGYSSVYHNGRYLCSMDRGVIPEFKLWTVKDGVEEIGMSDIERYDNTRVMYYEVLKTDAGYHNALLMAERGDDNYHIDGERVFRLQALRETKTLDRIDNLGWRHTFEAILMAKIPNVTREALGKKFNVDMNKVAVGPDAKAALYAE